MVINGRYREVSLQALGKSSFQSDVCCGNPEGKRPFPRVHVLNNYLRTFGGTPHRNPCSLGGLWGLSRDIGVIL